MAYRRPARGYSNRRGSFSSRRTTSRRRTTGARGRKRTGTASRGANRLVIEVVQASEVSRGSSVLKKLAPPSHKAKF